jgi:hypothetical protein
VVPPSRSAHADERFVGRQIEVLAVRLDLRAEVADTIDQLDDAVARVGTGPVPTQVAALLEDARAVLGSPRALSADSLGVSRELNHAATTLESSVDAARAQDDSNTPAQAPELELAARMRYLADALTEMKHLHEASATLSWDPPPSIGCRSGRGSCKGSSATQKC